MPTVALSDPGARHGFHLTVNLSPVASQEDASRLSGYYCRPLLLPNDFF